tara:strand:+ start:5084 stop:6658 length:1575 start_codon:yes stop_codon:yes gene_type:complete
MARRLFPFNRFIGLDTVTSPTNMSERFFVELEGAYVDFRGQIVRGPGVDNTGQGSTEVYNIAHYGSEYIVEYEYDGTDVDIRVPGTFFNGAFTASTAAITPISVVNFDQKQFSFMEGHVPKYWDGTAFASATTTNASSLGRYPDGGHAVNILNRLAVAGIPNKPTEIHISVQDSFDDWRTNTSGGTTPAATDGLILDVKNQFSSNDVIKGLAVLEGDKLVIFGQNETLVFLADNNINQWQIARDFRVPIGIFGRNTAVNVGTDIFFCSRFGIHSLRRAASGLTLETIMLSREIQDAFQDAVGRCPATGERQEPHAVWDGELGQYHVFFPRDIVNLSGTTETFDRLTFTYEPGVGRGGFRSFAFSPSTSISCASFFARPDTSSQISALQVGTWGHGTGDGQDLTRASKPGSGDMNVRTPLLSLNTPDQYKMFKRLIIRAVGTADFTVTVFDQDNNNLQSTTVRPEADSFASTAGISGDQTRPIDIPIPHRAKAISLQFSTTSSSSGYSVVGSLRILDFALVVDIK